MGIDAERLVADALVNLEAPQRLGRVGRFVNIRRNLRTYSEDVELQVFSLEALISERELAVAGPRDV